MSLFKKLFGSNKPKVFMDEFWGSLEYESKTDIYGKKQFSKNPKGQIKFYNMDVKINLECGKNGTNQEQKAFFIQINNEFPEILSEKLIPILNSELAKWLDVPSHQVNFDNDFILNELFLPMCLNFPVKWKMVLYYPKIDQFMTVHFVDFEPQTKIQFES